MIGVRPAACRSFSSTSRSPVCSPAAATAVTTRRMGLARSGSGSRVWKWLRIGFRFRIRYRGSAVSVPVSARRPRTSRATATLSDAGATITLSGNITGRGDAATSGFTRRGVCQQPAVSVHRRQLSTSLGSRPRRIQRQLLASVSTGEQHLGSPATSDRAKRRRGDARVCRRAVRRERVAAGARVSDEPLAILERGGCTSVQRNEREGHGRCHRHGLLR